eukprot:Gb_13777 [translate_table: standard]
MMSLLFYDPTNLASAINMVSQCLDMLEIFKVAVHEVTTLPYGLNDPKPKWITQFLGVKFFALEIHTDSNIASDGHEADSILDDHIELDWSDRIKVFADGLEKKDRCSRTVADEMSARVLTLKRHWLQQQSVHVSSGISIVGRSKITGIGCKTRQPNNHIHIFYEKQTRNIVPILITPWILEFGSAGESSRPVIPVG